MMVLALVDDLIFRSKLETAAAHLGVELRAASDVSVWRQVASGVPWQLELASTPRASRVVSVRDPEARSDDEGVLEAVRREGATPQPGPCRRNLVSADGLGRSASPRVVARRSRTRRRVRHASRASRSLHLGPARPREVLKPTLVIIDLNLAASDPLNGIREIRAHAPTLPIIGYCAHGQIDLQAQAKEAGCTSVLSRSALAQQLPQLLQAVQQ